MSQSSTLDSGRIVHQASMAVASGAPEHHAEVRSLGTLGTRPGAIDPLLRPRQANSQPWVGVDDAGPCGSWRSRALTHTGHGSWGVAPACLPTKPGAQVTTDRRAAIPRTRLMRSGALPPVHVPCRPAHRRWLRAVGCPTPAQPRVF